MFQYASIETGCEDHSNSFQVFPAAYSQKRSPSLTSFIHHFVLKCDRNHSELFLISFQKGKTLNIKLSHNKGDRVLWSTVVPDLGVDAAAVCVGDDIIIDGASIDDVAGDVSGGGSVCGVAANGGSIDVMVMVLLVLMMLVIMLLVVAVCVLLMVVALMLLVMTEYVMMLVVILLVVGVCVVLVCVHM